MAGIFIFSGDRLREKRQERDLTRERLAVQAELSYSMVVALEQGERNPSRAALRRIADALGVSPSELVEEDPDLEAAL